MPCAQAVCRMGMGGGDWHAGNSSHGKGGTTEIWGGAAHARNPLDSDNVVVSFSQTLQIPISKLLTWDKYRDI